MKLYRDEQAGLQRVTSYDAAHIAINRERFTHSLVVMPERVVGAWFAGPFEALDAAALQPLVALQPQLVIIGTGARQRFPQAAVLRPLIEARIGFEVMDTGSACRTYNILADEGRAVVAALMLDL